MNVSGASEQVEASSVDGPGNDLSIGERTLRKAMWRLIPLLSVCYAVAYMDRANVSYAALQMNRDLHFNASVYGFGAGVFFISYAACEIPSNLLLLRFGARRWIARILLTWGVLAGAMIFVRTPASFYTLRFLLGTAEAGFFPGALYYLSLWFPAEMRATAISRFYVAFPMSQVVMGLIAGTLLGLNGHLGLKGWQWLFVVEALPAVVLGVVVLRALPDSPETAKWLTPQERNWLTRRLASGPPATGHRNHDNHHGLAAVLGDRRVWLLGLYNLCSLGAGYAYAFSAPAIVQSVTGRSAGGVGLILAGIALLGAVSMVVGAQLSDRSGAGRSFVVGLCLLAGLGYLVAGLGHSPWVVLPALLLVSVATYGMQGPALSMFTSFLSGPAAALGIAAINMMGILGGFLGPNWMGWSITRTGSYHLGLALLVVPYIVAAMMILCVKNQTPASTKYR
jgi:ACS family tartrate transporter-like MFS transporter